MEETQRTKILDLLAAQHVAVLATQGSQGPTATLQAFAETPDLDLLFILGDSPKYQNLMKDPRATILVDDREHGDITTFRVNRVTIYGTVSEIPRGAEWDQMQGLFLKKNPFEKPFFDSPKLKMVRVKPNFLSFAGADYKTFQVKL